jgi:hypothetical protein
MLSENQSQKRPRPVAACVPCYQKKQKVSRVGRSGPSIQAKAHANGNKCDHQYPCTNCSRRRLPENCIYSAVFHDAHRQLSYTGSQSTRTASVSTSEQTHQGMAKENLLEGLGYFEGSGSNLLSLLDKYHLLGSKDVGKDTIEAIPARLLPEMNECFRLFPKRPILNSLVQFFIQDVNWMYEMMHPTLFLGRYEKWWRTAPGRTAESLHFGILILRICAYSAQFFPRTMTEMGAEGENQLLGVSMDKIREHCYSLASRLQRLCSELSGAKSLIWVQQLFYAACFEMNSGNFKKAWFTVGDAVRVLQDLGIHVEEGHRGQADLNGIEHDLGRRAFWNLYIWDRLLSLVLDRAPCIVDSHCSTDLPRMRLLSPGLSAAAPDVFTERILQAKLSKLWFSLCAAKQSGSSSVVGYDALVAEENYEEICRTFISQLPRAFDVRTPDRQWDSKLPALERQRQTLRISIFVVICHLFQPVLHLDTDQMEALPRHKRDLVARHREQLVRGAIEVLASINQLHQLMGDDGSSRFFVVNLFTFEAAMLLALHLLSRQTSQRARARGQVESEQQWLLFPSPVDATGTTGTTGTTGMPSSTTCRQLLEKALDRLTGLQDLNATARVGAQQLGLVVSELDARMAAVPSTDLANVANVANPVDVPAFMPFADDWLGLEMPSAFQPESESEDTQWGENTFSRWIAGGDEQA